MSDHNFIAGSLALLDYAPSGLFVVDEELRVLFWNLTMEKWSGQSRATLLGTVLSATYPRLALPRFLQPIQGVLNGKGIYTFAADQYHYLLPFPLPGQDRLQEQQVQVHHLQLPGVKGRMALFSVQDVSSCTQAIARQEEVLAALRAEMEEKEQVQYALDEERNFLQNVLDGVQDPIKVIDGNYEVLLMNRAAMQNVSSHSSMTCYSINYGRSRPCGEDHVCPVRQVIATRRSAQIIHEMYVNDTEKRFFETKASPLFRDDGSVWGIIEVSRDITIRLEMEEKLRASEAQQRQLAHHDILTGLPNRLMLVDRLRQALPKAHRHGHKVAVLFLDLDKFKNVNDTLGHDVGDELLCVVADRLQDCLRESDTVARLGGDEFVVILDEITTQHEIVVVCRKILRALHQPIILADNEIVTSVSIGVSLFPDDSQDVDGLLKCADSAMYLAKEQGRNAFQFYEAELHSAAFERILMENSLRYALERGEISLNYQPIIELDSGELSGVEALARWQGPSGDIIEPATFMPVAEESGLIIPIGTWVLAQACEQQKKWLDAGGAKVAIAVNLSARQFQQPDLVTTVGDILAASGLPPHYLTLEISEKSMMDYGQEAFAVLDHFHSLGIHIAIDNFGTGYSSLRYLARLPLDMLKIDREFVDQLLEQAQDQAVVSAVISLAHNLGIKVVAEGVESKEQHEWLKAKGCQAGQGFWYERPLGMEDFARRYGADLTL